MSQDSPQRKPTSSRSAKADTTGQPVSKPVPDQATSQPPRSGRRPKPNSAGIAGPGPQNSAGNTQRRGSRSVPKAKVKRPLATIETTEEELSWWESLRHELKRSLPAYLSSLVVHLVLLVILALITLPVLSPDLLDLTFGIGDDDVPTEDELLDDSFDLNLGEPQPFFQPEALEMEPPKVSMPLMIKRPDAPLLDPLQELSLKNALSGREQGTKESLLQEFGGTPGTESAVELGLEWLVKNQGRDGTWSMQGPYRDGTGLENRSAATALALLAFLGAGHTHQTGEYQRVVERGLKALLERQAFDGDFYKTDGTQSEIPNHHLYTHAQGMIVICELLAMTGDESLKEPAQKAVTFAEKYQSPEGGWRYTLGVDADLSVTGWFVIGLQSARMAGLEVQAETWENLQRFLYRVHFDDEIRFVYKKGYEPTQAMTAEGLLCRQYLGWKRDEESMLDGVNYLRGNPMDWENKDYYYWYYAAQVLHNVEGDAWQEWNQVMREALPAHQERSGRDKGSWDPDGDRYAMSGGGRLYATCLSLLVLEVYYRHLPIYRYSIE